MDGEGDEADNYKCVCVCVCVCDDKLYELITMACMAPPLLTNDGEQDEHGEEEVGVALVPVEDEPGGCRAYEASHGPNGEDGGENIVVDGQPTRQVQQRGSNDGDGASLGRGSKPKASRE